MSSALHRAAPRTFAALSALAFLSLLSCGREVTGPETRRMAMLALAPEFSGPISAIDGAGDAVPFERVRVLLRRDDGSIVKDTVVDFPSTAESISLTLTIPIPQDAPAGGLPLTVAMAYVNAAGDTVFRGGPSPLVARPVGTPGASDPVTVEVTYDGAGKDAARVLITPKLGNAVAGQTTAFAASAFDNADQIIANTPFVFSSVDTTRAIINPVTGVATWRAVRGTARVVAQLPNGLRADTATFTVALPASKLVLAAGNAQTGPVNAPLADTVVLRTLASDDVPVEGVIVNFAVATGGGALSVTTDTSDANGNVKTVWTLGGTLGAQTITATAPGLTGSPLTIGATATAATPVRVEIQAQPSTGVAGAALTPAITVIARDGFGNAVPSFTDSVVVSVLAANPPPVAGTLRRAPVSGTTTFDDLSLNLAGDVRFIVSSGSLAPDTTAAITIAPAAPAALAIVAAPPATVAAGATFGATVRVRDAFGNLVPTASEPIAVSFDASPAGASFLGGNAPIVPTLGLATFSALQLDRTGTYRLRFTSGALTAAVTTDFVVDAAAADTIFAQAGDAQTATAGTLLPNALAVAVRDTFSNPVPGVIVAWVVTSGDGTLDSGTSVTDAAGIAAVRWTLGGAAGAQTLRATVTGLPPVDFSATALAGTPAQVVFTQAPTTGSVADSLLPAPVVEIRDSFGNRITTYTGDVSIAFGANPTGATLLGTTTVSAVAGIATFNDLRIQVAGSGYTLIATAVTESLASAPTTAFGRTPGVAADFVITGGDAQTVVAGAPLALPFAVRLRDAFGNALANQAVRFTREAALASISDTLVLTDANGAASITGIAGTTAGSGLLAVRASVDGIATPLAFTATVNSGVATQVVFISQPDTAVAGEPFPPTLFVEFRDAFGNRVATLSDSVTMSIESGPVGGALLPASVRTQFIPSGGGPAGQFAGLEIEVAGTYVLRATTLGGLTGLSQPLVVIPDGFRQFTLVSGNNDTSAVNQPFGAPLRVRVTDSFGNPILGAITTWAVPSGGATLAADTVLTDVGGYAQNTATHSGAVTALGVIAANVVGSADTREFFYTTTAAAATQLVVTTQPPVTTTAGASFNVAVEARDAFGNRDLTYADSTFLVVNSGSVGATLSGVTRRAMVQGRVEFTGLSVDLAGDYTFFLSAPGLATTVSDTMRVTAAAAANVALASVSNDAQVGVAGDTLQPFRVRVTDAFGNPVSGVTVTWTETSGGSFVNPTSVTNANGEAESRAVAPLRTGLATFVAEVSGLSGSPVAFTATLLNLPPSELAITIAPSASIPAGVAVGDFVVRTQSILGEPTAFTDTIRVFIVDGPVGGRIIAGDTAVLADSSARFTGITFDIAGNYTLEFRAAGLDSVRYVPINVVPGLVASLTPFSGDGQSGAVTTTLSNPLVVEVRDAYGNLATGVDVQWAVASGDATLTVGLVTTDGNGRAAAGVVLGDTAGTVTVTASFDALTPATFTVTSVAGPATTPIEVTAPSSGTAGAALAAFSYGLVDAFGNIATGYTGTATVTLQAFGTSQPPVIASGDTAAVVNGVATWSALTVTSAGQYRIIADFGGTLGTLTSGVITIAPGAPALFANLGGDGQSAVVTQPFANPLRAQVTDAWGNGVSGVSVNFNIISGLASLSGTSIPTDSTGVAEAIATADTVAGPVLVGAFAAGLTPDSLLYALTVQAGVPAFIDSIVGGGQSVAAGTTSDSIRVRIADVYHNPVPGVTVTFSTESDLTLSAATATTDASGFAAITVTAGSSLGGFGIDADVFAQGLTASIPVTVVAGPATALEITTAPTTGTAGVTLDPITVRAVDAFGNPTDLVTDFVYVVVDSGPSGASIGVDTAVAPSVGQATFSSLATTTAGTYRLRAFVTVAGVTEALTGNIVISAAGATNLAYVSGDAQSMPPNATAADSLVVLVTDAFGNPVAGVPISWGVSVGTAVVSSATVATDSLGRSAITLTASQFAESGEVTAVNAGLVGSPVTFTYNTTAGAATRLAFAAEPSSVVAGGAQFFQVAALDAFGNTATAFTDSITISVDSGPASPVITGTLTQASTNGIADFADLVFQTAGNYRLRATAAGVTDTTSITFSVFVGDAAVLTVVSGDLQADTIGATLPQQLRVRLTDQFGNPVAGSDIDWLVASGNASLGFATTATDANGEATNGVQLSTIPGAFSVQAASVPANSTVLFNGTTLPGAPASVVVVSRPDTLQALTAGVPFVIELRDAFSNLATTAADTVFLTVNDGPPGGIVAGDTAVAPIAGVATFGNLQFGPTGTYILQFGINGVIDTLINLEVIAGEPTQIQQIFGMGQSAFATLPLDTAFTVRVRDAANNPVPGVTVTWTVLAGSGGGLIDGSASTTSVTDADGQASAFFTPGTTIGTQTVRAEVAALSVDFDVSVSELIGNSVWTGNVSTDWANPGNWINGQVPFAPDSVHILSGRPNYPVLLGDVAMTKLWVDDGVTSFDVSSHNVFVSGDIRVPDAAVVSVTSGTIRGVGAGTHTVSGTLPILVVENGSYSPVTPAGFAFTVAGDLVAQANGRWVLAANDSVIVQGAFRTGTGGRLEQAAGSDLEVAGDVEFGGGVSDLVGGRLVVGGNFSTTGSEQAAFRAAAAHVTQFVGGVQTVSLQIPDVAYDVTCAASCFGRLLADSTAGSDTLRFLTDAKARDGFDINNRGLLAPGRTLVNGNNPITRLRGDSTEIRILVIIDNMADIGFSRVIDTLVAAGSGTFSTGLAVPTVIAGNFSLVNQHLSSMVVEGTLTVDGPEAITNGSLITRGSGRLLMNDANDTLTVFGDATFNGSTQAGDLTNGVLRVRGAFSAGAEGFVAEGAHVTELFSNLDAPVSITNAGPGTGQNRFATLVLNKSSGRSVQPSTPIFVDGQLRAADPNQIILGTGSANPITARGADIPQLLLNNQPLVLVDGADVTTLQGLTFTGFTDPGQAQLRIERSGGGVSLASPTFDAAAASPPLYLVADDVAAGADTLVITVSNPTPTLNDGLVSLLNGARLVGWNDFAAIEWQGSQSNDWNNPLNWLQGRVPTAADSVIVPGLTPQAPNITSDVSVRSFIYQRLSGMTLSANLTIRNRYSGGGETSAISCGTGGRITLSSGDSTQVSGQVSCPVYVTAGVTRTTGSFTADSLIIEGSGEVHMRESDVVELTRNLRTADNGTLRMEGSTETLLIVRGDAAFRSLPTAGALSGGTIVLEGSFLQDSTPTAFRPGQDARVLLAGAADRNIEFANPDPVAGSYFGELVLELTGTPAVTLASDVFAQGSLIASFNAGGTLVSGTTRTLQSRGAEVSTDGGIAFENVRWEIIQGDTLANNLHNVTFSTIGGSALPQLRIVRDSGVVALNNFTFDPTATAALYLRLEDSAPADGFALQVTMGSPNPGFHAGAIDTIGGAQLLGWDAEPSFVWTGAAAPDGSWTNTANWISGVVPTATSVVTIPSSVTQFPAITAGPVTIRGLINQSDTIGVFLGTGVDLVVTDQLQLTPTGEGVSCQDNTARLLIGGNATTLSGNVFGCDVVATGGTASIADSLFIGQNLLLNGDHALDINGGTLAVTFAMTLTGSARLIMDAPEDSVIISGNTSFGGGSNTVTAGFLQVGGDFSVTGSATFQASGGHLTDLWDRDFGDNGTRQLTIGNPTPGAVAFRELTFSSGNRNVTGGVLSVLGNFSMLSGVTTVSDSAIVIAGDFVSPTGNQIDAPRIAVGALYQFAGNQLADTVEFTGTAQAIPSAVSGTPVRFPTLLVSGTAFAQTNGLATDTLFVDGNLAVVNGGTLTVGDAGGARLVKVGSFIDRRNLQTLGGGRLAMPNAGAELLVSGSASFAGGDQTGLLTDGVLIIESDFAGSGVNNFVATGAHRTVLGGAPLDFHNISDDNGDLRFATLQFAEVGVLALTSLTADTLRQGDAGSFTQAVAGQRLTVTGRIESGESASLDVSHLTLGGAFEHHGTQVIDTLVLNGTGQLLPRFTSLGFPPTYNRVEVTGQVTTDIPAGQILTISDSLIVRDNGSLRFTSVGGATGVSIAGDLVTRDNGVIRMDSTGTGVTVLGNARFGGGSTNGLITGGTLRIRNGFYQTNATSPESFRATEAHVTEFEANDGETFVQFDSPGNAGASGFANIDLFVTGPADSLRLGSDVFASGTMSDNAASVFKFKAEGGPRTLSVGVFNADAMVFDGVNLAMTNVTSETNFFDFTFTAQDPTRTQLEIIANADAPVFPAQVTFDTPPTTGRYVRAEATGASTLNLFFSGTSPLYHAGFLETAGTGTVTVTGWEAAEPPNGFDNTYVGLDNDFWEDQSNWSLFRVPTLNDNVIIPAGLTVRMNDMNGGETYLVRSLNIAAGALLVIDADTIAVRRDVSVAGGIDISESQFAVLRMVPTAETPVTLGGGGTITGVQLIIDPPTVGTDTVVSLTAGGLTVGRSVWVAGGRLDLNGQTLVTDTLITTNTGRISMLNATDSLQVNMLAQFGGASTESLLTDGRLVLGGSFEQLAGSPQAFAASGNHRTLLTSVSPSLFFNNPGATASHFGSLQPMVDGTTATLGSDVYVTTNLVNESVNVTYTAVSNQLLQTGGLRNNGASTSFSNVRVRLVDGGSDFLLNSLTFISMDPTVTYLTVDRSGGTTTFPDLVFGNAPSAGGFYLAARDTVDNSNDLVVSVSAVQPGGHDGLITTSGDASITGWDQFDLYTFTGAVSNSLGDPLNWFPAVLPSAISNVRFNNASSTFGTVTLGGQQYRNVSFAAGSQVSVDGTVSARTVNFETAPTCTATGGFSLSGANVASAFLSSSAETCGLTIASNSYFFSANATWRSLRINTGAQMYFGVGGTEDVTVTLRDSLVVPTGGEIYMNSANDTLTVEGLAVLQAGSVASLLDGTLNVWESFVSEAQVGGNTSTTNLYLGNPTTPSSYSARIGNDAGWGIDSVFLHDGTLTVLDSMYVRQHLGRANAIFGTSIQGGRLRVGTTGDAPPHLLADGSFALGESDDISVNHLEVFGSLTGAGALAADTTTFLGRVSGAQQIPADNGSGPGAASYNYGLIRVLANAIMQSEKAAPDTAYFISQGIEVRNGVNLRMTGTGVNPVLVSMPNGTLSVDGFGTTFSLDGTDVHVLVDSVFIRSNAQSVLEGSNTSLNIRSDLIAEGLSGFDGMLSVTSSEHVTRFIGSGTTGLGLSSGDSRLGTTEIRGGTTRTLLSDLIVSTVGREGSTLGLITFQTPAPGADVSRRILTYGTDFVGAEGSVLMRNVSFDLRSTASQPGVGFALDNVTFQQMDPDAVFIYVDFDDSQNPTFNNITFDSPVTSGSYLFFDAGLVTGTPSVSFVNASPSVGCLASTCLPGNVAPDGVTTTATFVDLGSTGDWDDPNAWSTNAVPNASTDVIIPSGQFAVMFGRAQARSVTVQSGGTLFFTSSDTLNLWGNLQVDGTFGGTNGVVRMRHVAGGSTLAVSGSMAPALFVTGGVGGLEDVVTLSGNVTRTEAFGGSTTVEAGILDLGTHAYVDSLGFATVGTGRLRMMESTASLTAGQLMRFAGGSTDGLLTAGTITVSGNFEALGSNGAFRAEQDLVTRFARNGPQNVTLTLPGFGPLGSHFGDIELVSDHPTAALQLNSDLWASGQLRTTAFGATNRIVGVSGNRLVQLRGAEFSDSLVLDAVKLRIDDGDAIGAMNGLRFLNLTETGQPALEIARAGGTITMFGTTFDTGAGFTNNFLVARDTDAGDASELTVDFGGTATPAFHGGRILLQDGAVLLGWEESAPNFSAVWTGAVSDEWGNSGNWQDGVLPNASANVTINAGTFAPTIPFNSFANDFTVTTGALATIADGAVFTVYGNLTVDGTLSSATVNALVLMRPDGPVTLSTVGTMEVPLEITSGVLGNLGVVNVGESGPNYIRNGLASGFLSVTGSTLSIGNGTLILLGSFETQSVGRLLMSGTGTLATFGDASFAGLQSDLTNGTLVVSGNVIQNATNSRLALVSTGNHLVSFQGSGDAEVFLESSSPTESRLGRVEFRKETPSIRVNFASESTYVERISDFFDSEISVGAFGFAHLYVMFDINVSNGFVDLNTDGFMTFLAGDAACDNGTFTIFLAGLHTGRFSPEICFLPP